jgi:hypothetical protein
VGVGLLLGATLDALRPGLEGFAGVERRFQRLGDVGGVSVVDDYAHHPTEVEATLTAARAAYPGRRVVAAFQPHLFSRTRDFAPAFARALSHADAVFLTEIYPAREQPIAGVTSALIADAARDGGRPVTWRGERSALAEALAAAVADGDVVLTLGRRRRHAHRARAAGAPVARRGAHGGAGVTATLARVAVTPAPPCAPRRATGAPAARAPVGVTSPAPSVSTTSPSATAAASASASALRSPRHVTGRPPSRAASAMSADVTPAIGCSRAG